MAGIEGADILGLEEPDDPPPAPGISGDFVAVIDLIALNPVASVVAIFISLKQSPKA